MCLDILGRLHSLVLNRERRGRFSNFEGPVSSSSGGNMTAPNSRPSNMVMAFNFSFLFNLGSETIK